MRTSHNLDAGKRAAYGKQYAEPDTVEFRARRLLHAASEKLPTFNVESSKKSMYYKQHPEGGTVHVGYNKRPYDARTRQANIRVDDSKTPVTTPKMAWSASAGGASPLTPARCVGSFTTEGSKTSIFCKQSGNEDMVNVSSRMCGYDSCQTTGLKFLGKKDADVVKATCRGLNAEPHQQVILTRLMPGVTAL